MSEPTSNLSEAIRREILAMLKILMGVEPKPHIFLRKEIRGFSNAEMSHIERTVSAISQHCEQSIHSDWKEQLLDQLGAQAIHIDGKHVGKPKYTVPVIDFPTVEKIVNQLPTAL